MLASIWCLERQSWPTANAGMRMLVSIQCLPLDLGTDIQSGASTISKSTIYS